MIMSNACRFLPVLLGAVCGPWLQGLINSGLGALRWLDKREFQMGSSAP